MRTRSVPDKVKKIYEEEGERRRSSYYEEGNPIIFYRKRYLMIVIFFFLAFTNGITFTFFNSMTVDIEKGYDIPATYVNLPPIINMALYIPSNFLLSNNTFLKYGTHVAILIGGCLNIVCLIFRLFINKIGYIMAVIGSVFGALGQPFILNAAPQISSNWFGTKERALATTIATLGSPIGSAMGFVLPNAVYMHFKKKSGIKDGVFYSCFIMGIILAVIIIICLIFFRQKPPTPPSAAADKDKISLKESWKILCKRTNTWKLGVVFGIFYGALNTVAAILAQIIEPFDQDVYDGSAASLIGLFFTLFGLFGAFGVGMYLGKTKKYKRALMFVTILCLLSSGFFVGTLFIKNKILTIFAGGIFGFFLMPIVTLCYEFSAELGFPVDENATCGFILCFSQIWSVFTIGGASFALKHVSTDLENPLICLGILLFSVLIGIIVASTIKEELLRIRNDEALMQKSKEIGKSVEKMEMTESRKNTTSDFKYGIDNRKSQSYAENINNSSLNARLIQDLDPISKIQNPEEV